jgi:O-antigen/teichoic acid export membrane protein
MRKFEKLQVIKNVGSSWFSLSINILVGFFLSPFIIHRLGDAAFGIWVLIFSITGYYGLFDLGIRSSIVRYVSKYTATGETQALAKLINTSLFSYSAVGVLSMLVTCVGAALVDSIFHIPAEFHSSARWLLLMVGGAVALGFPLGIFGGILEGLQRFYILNWTNVASTLLRAGLIVYFLHRGYGLLTTALITVSLPLLTSVLRGIIALRILPVPFGQRYVDRAAFREMANYSGITFVIMVAARLRFKTDEIVIGAFLSSVAITYFNIGARIVDYAGEVVSSLAQIFVPLSSQSDATGNMDRLRKIFVAGNRFCAFTIFPICAVLVILGKSVIAAWVGEKYVALSYPVLLIMLIPSTLLFAQAASPRVLFGMGKHRTLAIVALIEGIANIILSVVLVRRYGIIGDAVGTAVPLVCTMVFFMPSHLCRQLGIRVITFVREAYTLPLLSCLPLVTVLLLMQRRHVGHSYKQLAFRLSVGGLVYGLCLAWAFVTNKALRVGDLSIQEKPAEFRMVTPSTESYQQDI